MIERLAQFSVRQSGTAITDLDPETGAPCRTARITERRPHVGGYNLKAQKTAKNIEVEGKEFLILQKSCSSCLYKCNKINEFPILWKENDLYYKEIPNSVDGKKEEICPCTPHISLLRNSSQEKILSSHTSPQSPWFAMVCKPLV